MIFQEAQQCDKLAVMWLRSPRRVLRRKTSVVVGLAGVWKGERLRQVKATQVLATFIRGSVHAEQ